MSLRKPSPERASARPIALARRRARPANGGAANGPARRPPPVAARGDGDLPRQLLDKYKELCAKYQALVQRHEATVAEASVTISLALTAMRTSLSPLALFSGDRIVAQNTRWNQLNRLDGDWRVLADGAPDGGERWARLEDLARREALALFARGGAGGQRLRLCEHVPSGRVVELHVERGGRARTAAAIVHDVTERHRAERELAAARAAMFEQERMRAVGELASGVAHDLNNALHALSMRLSVLRAAPATPEQVRQLDAVAGIVSDASVRVGRLQEFARRRHDAPHETVDLAAVVEEAIELARPELEASSQRHGRRLRVESSIGEVPPVIGVAAELKHVFVNLLLNARDAMIDGGAIRISGEASGGELVVTVADDGPGIAPEHLERVFEPFFTTKEQKGTGLGLAVAWGVMQRLGGSISVANGPPRGAVFTLRFPVSSGERAAPAPAPAGEVVPGQRVLVVDDDDDNLEATRIVLEGMGQLVTTAASGAAAIERVRGGERFDLVLCDVGMPDLNGWQTVREIRALAPEVRIHMLTGWAQEIASDEPLRALVQGVLPKPLDLSELRRLLVPPA